jgi:EAL domain-containing protein (putative c-di-GMP-specific phosphodiesterase class I)
MLSYLQRFPFDKIKIDRRFVNDLAEQGGSAAIVQAVVNIAAAQQMTTIAEGVETTEQRNSCAPSVAPKCKAISSALPYLLPRRGNYC